MKEFIQNNRILATLILFLSMFTITIIIKPPFMFNKDGSFKEFGLGYTNKSILPIWILVIIFSIISYFFITLF